MFPIYFLKGFYAENNAFELLLIDIKHKLPCIVESILMLS